MAIFQEHRFFYFPIYLTTVQFLFHAVTQTCMQKNDNGEVKEYEVIVYQVQEKRD